MRRIRTALTVMFVAGVLGVLLVRIIAFRRPGIPDGYVEVTPRWYVTSVVQTEGEVWVENEKGKPIVTIETTGNNNQHMPPGSVLIAKVRSILHFPEEDLPKDGLTIFKVAVPKDSQQGQLILFDEWERRWLVTIKRDDQSLQGYSLTLEPWR